MVDNKAFNDYVVDVPPAGKHGDILGDRCLQPDLDVKLAAARRSAPSEHQTPKAAWDRVTPTILEAVPIHKFKGRGGDQREAKEERWQRKSMPRKE